MNKEEIIKLAREVGLLPDNLHPAPQTHHMAQKQKNLERFAALVAAAEREACASICFQEGPSIDGELIAAAIRARGEK